jgi:HEAT repeat protein
MTTPRALIEELRAVGVPVKSLSDLLNRSYREAVPVMLDWLRHIDKVPVADRAKLREMLVRCLSVPVARGVAAPVLIEEFQQARDTSGLGIRWVIANALSVVADETVFDDLVTIARDRSYGRAREMLMLAIARTENPKAVDVLLELLNDDEVAGHAVMALGNLGERKARPAVEQFLEHPKPWVREEAKKALVKLPA